jgi:type I restriction enzyme M protein
MSKKNGMIGAIIGDIAGSRFEFANHKGKDFELFVECRTFDKITEESLKMALDSSTFTDDSVMTLAIADAILRWKECNETSYDTLSKLAVQSMRKFGKMFPLAGYGGTFDIWLHNKEMCAYNSWGNGAAMRVSACGWAGQTLDEVKAMSRTVTEVTHNHPEGIKGAEATAVATFLARTGKSMEEIREVIVRDYYPLDFTLDEIRPTYEFDVSCQGSVPQALEAFFESTSFEDAIRNAISIGGDSDTIGAICGAVAGAYYGVPEEIRSKAETFLDKPLLDVLYDFENSILDVSETRKKD